MTLQNLKDEITEKGEIPMYGMKFRLLDDDLVRIFISNNKFEMRYDKFVSTSDLGFSTNIMKTELTKLTIEKDEKLPHKMILVIDLRPKKKKKVVDTGINARMKLN